MLQLIDVTMLHVKDFKPVIKELTICINKGDKVAIIGDEGNGKSTLLKFLANPALIEDYIKVEGKITDSFQTRIYLPQLFEEDTTQTLSDYFFSDDDLDYGMLYRLADELGFDGNRFVTPQTLGSLSGGEQLKIQLIKKLSYDADLILLDEPSNNLDIRTLEWLEKYIQTSRKTIVFVSHDERLLERTANKVIHLEQIKKRSLARTSVHQLDYDSYITEREHHFQKEMQLSKKEKLEHDKKVQKHERQRQKVESALRACHDSTQGRLLAKKMRNLISHEKRYVKEKERLTSTPIQEEAITLKFKHPSKLGGNFHFYLENEKLLCLNHQTVLCDSLSLRINSRDKIGIVGDNGVGKTTLLIKLKEKLSKNKKLKIGFMPQDYEQVLKMEDSPLVFFMEKYPTVQKEELITLMSCLNFSFFEINHSIAELSGGQKAKLVLLNLVLEEPDLLLLDEPTRNFSPLSQPKLRQLFKEFDGPIVAVSHDRQFLDEVCQDIFQLDKSGLKEWKF
ncbi:MAG: ATP-binding cassette domain-containing protein [Streptococcus sp.]|nr:ATP-binding cassette domain-containing protein [Streptococcus sp.]